MHSIQRNLDRLSKCSGFWRYAVIHFRNLWKVTLDDIAATEKTRNGKGLAGDTDMSVWSLGASVCFLLFALICGLFQSDDCLLIIIITICVVLVSVVIAYLLLTLRQKTIHFICKKKKTKQNKTTKTTNKDQQYIFVKSSF